MCLCICVNVCMLTYRACTYELVVIVCEYVGVYVCFFNRCIMCVCARANMLACTFVYIFANLFSFV